MRLQVPLFVRGVDASGAVFLDLIKTLDISSTGALLAGSRPLNPDAPLHLTIPAPSPASWTYSSVPPETPPIQARIRRQESSGELQLIGVEFVKPLD
jgi:hypothetical protein